MPPLLPPGRCLKRTVVVVVLFIEHVHSAGHCARAWHRIFITTLRSRYYPIAYPPFTSGPRQRLNLNLNPSVSHTQIAEPTSKATMKPRRRASSFQ